MHSPKRLRVVVQADILQVAKEGFLDSLDNKSEAFNDRHWQVWVLLRNQTR